MEVGSTNNIPRELIVDILSRLPAVDLWPLRCVCKPWFQLITKDPQFAKSVFSRSIQFNSNPTSIIARREKPKPSSTQEEDIDSDFYMVTDHAQCDNAIQLNDLPFADSGRSPVYGICNGMLCVSPLNKHKVYIWNPLTNDHVTIPYPATPLRSPGNRLNSVFGFGFLHCVDEYKVVRLVGQCGWGSLKYHTQLSVYTLGVDSCWRIVAGDIPYDISFNNVPCPHIDGFVYWLASNTGELPVSTVLGFDLKDELLYEIDHPPINFRCSMTCLQELGGSLCLFNASSGVDVNIWKMKLDGGCYSWTILFTIGRSEVVGDFSLLVPLGVVAQSGDVIVLKNSTELITYNLNTKSINQLKEFSFPICNAHAYHGSIISPRVISGARHIMAQALPQEKAKDSCNEFEEIWVVVEEGIRVSYGKKTIMCKETIVDFSCYKQLESKRGSFAKISECCHHHGRQRNGTFHVDKLHHRGLFICLNVISGLEKSLLLAALQKHSSQ